MRERARVLLKMSIWNPEEKRLLGRTGCKWENIIKMDAEETGSENLD
jgi:hypothetical protein